MSLTLRSLKQLEISDLNQFFISRQDDKINHLENQADLTTNINQKREEITTLLEHLSSQKPGRETLRFLDEKEQECQRLIYEIEELQKKIDKCSYLPSKLLREILSKFQELVYQNEKEPENEQILERLNKIIKQVEISSAFRKNEQKFPPDVNVKLDIEALIGFFYSY